MYPQSFDGETANAILRRLSMGVAVIDRDGRILVANAAAAALIDGRDGLREEDGRLAAEMGDQTSRLRQAFRLAADNATPSAMQVRRSRTDKSLTLGIVSLAAGRALLTVFDPERSDTRLIEQVRSIFRLSPAEADVAVGLANGSELSQIASRRGVSLHTARAQLAAAMTKTGVRRQAELVAAVLNANVAA